jgi:hypothetical protein
MIALESVTVFRGGIDRKGNVSKEPVGEVEVAFDWGSGLSRSMGDFDRAESASGAPHVFVAKGADLKARDRIERGNGERYSVVGHPVWEQPHEVPVFGQVWVVFKLESMNG